MTSFATVLCGGFLPWLEARRRDGWELVTDSVRNQTEQTPFVVCKKGDKKSDGRFPLRACEGRTGGESVYWCVGGKQVGKAAIQFWRDTLLPLMDGVGDDLAIWPFQAIDGRSVVVAECYPAMLQRSVWGRRVTKSDPADVVDAVHAKFSVDSSLCDLKTWFYAVSSEDEFDAFTTALAVAATGASSDALLTAPNGVAPTEGWMLLLTPEPAV